MVTIKRIEIEDFLGQGNLVWNLDPEVNILGGKNGSGKSTILKVCYELMTIHTIPCDLEEYYKKVFNKFTITFSNDWSIIWSKDAIVGPCAKNNERKSVDLQKFTQLEIRPYLINSFEQHLSKASIYDQQPKSSPLDDPTMLDLMIKDQIDQRNSKFSQAMEGFIDAPDGDDQQRTNFVQNYKKIYESLSHFLTGYDEPFKSSFEFVRNGQKFGYEHLSMGEKQILLLLLMVSNTDQQPCIFLMDEPDLSMHIDWKEILVKELHTLNSNMQIILTTHAPSVITGRHNRVQEVSQLIKN
ncbi:MAG: AAA family ATPase [Bacteroidales bacterium]|nr:AAA family ATPase [Bacteroidales bacterium]